MSRSIKVWQWSTVVKISSHLVDQKAARADVLHVLLCKVDEAGEYEKGDHDEEEEEAELLVSLLQGEQEGLESSEVPDQLVDPQDSHDPHKTDNLASLANDLEILQPFQQQGEVERDDRHQVDQVHEAGGKL